MPKHNVANIFPLTPLQEGMLFHYEMAPASPTYWNQLELTLRGELNPLVFRQAWELVVARHAALRTGFARTRAGKPVQLVHRRASLDFTSLEPGDEDYAQVQERFETLAAQARDNPPNLAKPPLVAVLVAEVAPGRWRLVWSQHHIILDGWSWPIVLREVLESYGDLLDGRQPEQNPGPDFSEFVAWLMRQDKAAARDFWSAYLPAEKRHSLLCPPDEERSTADARRRTLGKTLNAEESEKLRQLCRGRRVTLNTLVQCAWGLTLATETGAGEAVFGVTLALRPVELDGVENMVGMALTTVPVRIDAAFAGGTDAWLQQHQSAFQKLSPHAHCSLTEIAQWSAAESAGELFDSILVFENFPFDDRLGGRCEALEVQDLRAHETTTYPVTLQVLPLREIQLNLSFAESLLPEARAARIWERFFHLLQALAAAGSKPLAGLDRLLPGERETLSRVLSGPPAEFPAGVTGLVAAEVARRPLEPAVRCGGAQRSYGELWSEAAAIAQQLSATGVGPGSLVALGMDRSVHVPAAILAVWGVGAAYVPVAPSLPDGRVEQMLAVAEVSVVICDARSAARFAPLPLRVVVPDEGGPPSEAAFEFSAPQRGDLAYVMFTSGSTGQPNGVTVTHGGVANMLQSIARRPGFSAGESMLAITTWSFDISVVELFLPLTRGGSVVIARGEDILDGASLAAAIERARPSVLQATPVTWNMLVQAGWKGRPGMKAFCGGEPLARRLADELNSRVHSLWNLYGPTETTVYSTGGRIEAGQPVHIGQPVANTRLLIVDPQGLPTPPGVTGELLIGGAGLAEGYLGNPGLTQERFVVRETMDGGAARWFRSGDLASLNDRGEVLLHGRVDRQIKLRGFRIEVGDIESHLAAADDVEQVAVTLRSWSDHELRLTAFVVMKTGVSLDSRALRAWLAQRLPDYMIPQHFVQLQKLPLTHSRKVDYAALPELQPDAGAAAPGVNFSDTQGRVAELWCSLLGSMPSSPSDNFLQLGGHSLLVARLAGLIERKLDVSVAIRDLLSSPTLAEHAGLVDSGGRGGRTDVPVARDRARFPMSSFQRRLWFLEQLEPAAGVHNVCSAFRLRGQVDEPRLEQAFAALAARHEVLRTRFVAEQGEAIQLVDSAPRIDWAAEMVSDEGSLRQRLGELRGCAFDLGQAPPWCVRLLRAGQESVLVMTFHHMVIDGESMSLLLEELAASYAGEELAEAASPRLQYGDFATWQREREASGAFEQDLEFWRDELAGPLPVLSFPSFVPRPSAQQFAGDAVSLEIGGELLARLRAAARDSGTSLFSQLLCGFAAVLMRYSRQRELVIGTPVGTLRHTAHADSSIGPYLNTVALRLAAPDEWSHAELLAHVAAKTRDAMGHGEAPFEAVVAELDLPRDLSRTPVFQTLFSYRQLRDEPLGLAGLEVRAEPLAQDVARTDLSCWVEESGQSVRIQLEFASALFEPGMLRQFGDHLKRYLAEAAANPDLRWSEVPLLADHEQQALLARHGSTGADAAAGTIQSLVWAVARQSASRVAVSSPLDQLSYRELQQRALTMAAGLRDLGVEPGMTVGLALSRGALLPAAMLAVWEAGAACVPLDLRLPEPRLRHVVEDSGIRFVLHDQESAPVLPGFTGTLLALETLEGRQGLAAEPEAGASPPGLAYIMYTSGSTGLPKGVAVGHRQVVNMLEGFRQTLGVSGEDVLAAITTTSFDISVLELLLPLTAGARVHVVPEAAATDGRALASELLSSGATMMQGTPASWRLLLEAGWTGDAGLTALCGGEALPLDLARSLSESSRALWNLYGPTETTVWSTAAPLKAPVERISIGRPIRNTAVYIVDKARNLAPDGVEGEIVIGGEGVAIGYHNNPELTAERFLEDGYGGAGRIYFTGDLGRWLPTGELEHRGRLDSQLKVFGHRIEAGDVEVNLRSAPGVKQAAVTVQRMPGREATLVAFVVLEESNRTLDPMALRRHLRARVPRYMVPQQFTALRELPLTPNGKVDYAQLPQMDAPGLNRQELIVPQSEAERLIAETWRRLLQQDVVSVTDNFLDLGGHSLLVMQAAYEIEQASGVRIPPQLFFFGDLRNLARYVEDQRTAEPAGKSASTGRLKKMVQGLLDRGKS